MATKIISMVARDAGKSNFNLDPNVSELKLGEAKTGQSVTSQSAGSPSKIKQAKLGLAPAPLGVPGASFVLPPAPGSLTAMRRSGVRRQISPQSGRALEALGHAIEYLADEFVLRAQQSGILNGEDPSIVAMQILMSLSRQVYYACPEVEPALPRLARWLLRSRAAPLKGTN